jgi:hypothetical protein
MYPHGRIKDSSPGRLLWPGDMSCCGNLDFRLLNETNRLTTCEEDRYEGLHLLGQDAISASGGNAMSTFHGTGRNPLYSPASFIQTTFRQFLKDWNPKILRTSLGKRQIRYNKTDHLTPGHTSLLRQPFPGVLLIPPCSSSLSNPLFLEPLFTG